MDMCRNAHTYVEILLINLTDPHAAVLLWLFTLFVVDYCGYI